MTRRSLLSVFIVVLLGLSPMVSFASLGWHFFSGSKQVNQNAMFALRLPAIFYDDITTHQKGKGVNLTDAQKHQAMVWSLKPSEEHRYVFLMQNRSGTYYKNTNLTPVQILGINARTDSERDHYAGLAAKQRAQRTAKELAFNTVDAKAYSELMNRYHLKPVRAFNVKPFSPYSYQPIALVSGDQVMFFTKINSSVRPIIASLMSSLMKIPGTVLNVYFVGHKINEHQITQWAKSQNIPPSLVSLGKVTLNFGNSRYDNLKGQPHLPALYVIRSGKTTEINTGRF